MKSYRAEIEWLDPYGAGEWLTRREARKLKPATCRTHGWVIYEDGERVVVAASRTDDGWGDVTAIPGGCVIEIRAVVE